jgi:anti-sigma-K factor RskA
MDEDDEILAGEYVLGTLHADERTVLRSVMTHDAAMRAQVEAWDRRLVPLATKVPEVAPPPEVWTRIEAALEPVSSGIFMGMERARADLPSQFMPVLQLRGVGAVDSARRALNRWRMAAGLASALAAMLMIFIISREVSRLPEVRPSYIAALNRDGDAPALIARVDFATGHASIRPVEAETPPGKSLELWYICEGRPPRSMGLIGHDAVKAPLPRDASAKGAMFAVTIEPEGGSITGGPTGPVIYSGHLIRE